MRRYFLLTALMVALALTGCQSTSSPEAQELPQSSTYIENKGSDTMVNLALVWAENYQAANQDVRISVTGGGSGTGLAALVNGTVDVANASRQIKPEEQDQIAQGGHQAVEYVVASDAIAVIVNPGNPIQNLTLEEISRIYKGEINNWAELGGENRPIVRLSRETNSGTHVYFLEEVIRLGSSEDKSIFSADTLLLPSSEGIITEVRDNPNAIGYDGLGYVTPDVKVISVAADRSHSYVQPTIETVKDGSYPISRDLYMYTTESPSQVVQNYLEWVYSAEAQQIVSELGFVPVTPSEGANGE
ncbi:MAG: phosphate ABC transporter substrate-binding protein [Chloroflexi bacterium]|nr:phosphate ABC transporter substrate-binding protein [Chloroflexota bacterium]